ncbi:hypothetical protein A3E65_02955 [Candidatus Kaiserbacteria bacterium RIFCSPHIGHO2_12_FULL_56_13]|uniref:UDP-glucose/GDP-mannose dehydrogenase dimerisation domain-containing protein n=1 Tax=Candidatus Kaiserbacteria bacterium RIFCSPHIGHO2_12_FULL_56_13 TaxID=1798505 RepID=A0A1F6EF79_9BACT|nr:MAG: hypothetical protein A3E65_02955 [Candidatus Kaiserbacteria bacterium RIFCSPHIGHO2_12_FULL_56_13]
MKIGFIGQGWVGKHYANDFERRGYRVVRYGLEKRYAKNREVIKNCDIVFIAVPTPTTPKGFDDSAVRAVLPLVGNGKIAVIKSTLLPGTTERLQKAFPHCFVLHSPEFLAEATAAFDAAHPNRNLIGIPKMSARYRAKARRVLAVLPNAPYQKVMHARDAEFVKYAGNCFLFTKVVFMNLLYDLIVARGADWRSVRDAFINDPRIGASHTNPLHKTGRGAGGHCFIKDFEAFHRLYKGLGRDRLGVTVLEALKEKNLALLIASGKDLELLRSVYGPSITRGRGREKKR